MDRKLFWVLALTTVIALGIGAAAVLQGTATPQSDFPAVISERTPVRAGPGDTYEILGLLGAGEEVTVTERNRVGNWLHIIREDGDESTPDYDGWVLTGFLAFDAKIRFSRVPVANSVEDADLSAVEDADLRRLYTVPVVPRTISRTVRQIYERGQALDNHSNVVSKVGDSNSANPLYLAPIAEGNYDLGPYDYLKDTVEYFDESFGEPSETARIGLNAFSVFDPLWSNETRCEPNEEPLVCEYRRKQPSIAIIMFGQNDTRVLNSEQYDEQIRKVVEETIDRGIIPVLLTFSSDPADEDIWFQAVRFNLIMVDIAEEYNIPIINLWSAARVLPRYGIGEDNAHMTASGESVNLNGHESRYGVTLHNLLVLYTLDLIAETLNIG